MGALHDWGTSASSAVQTNFTGSPQHGQFNGSESLAIYTDCNYFLAKHHWVNRFDQQSYMM